MSAVQGNDSGGDLIALLREVAEGLNCCSDDDAHYCPRCDNSLFNLRQKVHAALASQPHERRDVRLPARCERGPVNPADDDFRNGWNAALDAVREMNAEVPRSFSSVAPGWRVVPEGDACLVQGPSDAGFYVAHGNDRDNIASVILYRFAMAVLNPPLSRNSSEVKS